MSNRHPSITPIHFKSENHQFYNKENRGIPQQQQSIVLSAINYIKRDLQELKEGTQEISQISSEISGMSRLLKDLRSEVNYLKDQQMEILFHFNNSTSNSKETMTQNKYQNSLDAEKLKQELQDPKFMVSVFNNYNKIGQFAELRYYLNLFK